jgi:predicted GIY-YIG superfamily endonuclease
MKQYIMYKIICADAPIYIYIGCTSNFRKRKNLHKCMCTKSTTEGHNRKLYKVIRKHGGWDNWDMIPFETFECNTEIQAHKRETKLMDTHKTNLNSVVSHRQSKK